MVRRSCPQLAVLALVLGACSTHADVTTPGEVSAPAVPPGCTDVAAATLNLAEATSRSSRRGSHRGIFSEKTPSANNPGAHLRRPFRR